ncbi:hypothetical protein [Nostoc sp.]|uniref:hypothetical protein n=1 Tax=Nostoc sp. TaxID=1180 RepID=UPI003FA5CA03
MTPKGVHLIWVEEVIQPQLDEQLRQKIITESCADWLKQQINAMKIVTHIDSDGLQSESLDMLFTKTK